MSNILKLISSQSFIEKVMLLALTGVLTGILVPYISVELNHQHFKSQKDYEAQIARQNKIIDAQNELLIEIEELVNTFLLRALAVGWYKVFDKNSERFEKSRNEYENNSWAFFGKMQTSIGKASRLTSPNTYKELEMFYDSMRSLDKNLVDLLKRDASEKEWKNFYSNIQTDYGNLIHMISLLSKDYGLSKECINEYPKCLTNRPI